MGCPSLIHSPARRGLSIGQRRYCICSRTPKAPATEPLVNPALNSPTALLGYTLSLVLQSGRPGRSSGGAMESPAEGTIAHASLGHAGEGAIGHVSMSPDKATDHAFASPPDSMKLSMAPVMELSMLAGMVPSVTVVPGIVALHLPERRRQAGIRPEVAGGRRGLGPVRVAHAVDVDADRIAFVARAPR